VSGSPRNAIASAAVIVKLSRKTGTTTLTVPSVSERAKW
jgi:hypothetical protein